MVREGLILSWLLRHKLFLDPFPCPPQSCDPSAHGSLCSTGPAGGEAVSSLCKALSQASWQVWAAGPPPAGPAHGGPVISSLCLSGALQDEAWLGLPFCTQDLEGNHPRCSSHHGCVSLSFYLSSFQYLKGQEGPEVGQQDDGNHLCWDGLSWHFPF